MPTDDPIPGTWPVLSRAGWTRLTALARWRLGDEDHAADDVVSRAVIKWTTIDEGKQQVARLEQVVKSESLSWIRSEQRRRLRQDRFAADRSRAGADPPTAAVDLRLMIQELARLAIEQGIVIDEQDHLVLADLLAGRSMAAIADEHGMTRHQVLTSRSRWRTTWRLSQQEPRE